MAIESDADRLAFLDVGAFGSWGVYTPDGSSARPAVRGIFDRPFQAVGAVTSMLDVDGVGFGSTMPTFLCRTSDLPADAADGDGLTVLSGEDGGLIGEFTVRVVEHDGTGMTTLRVEVTE